MSKSRMLVAISLFLPLFLAFASTLFWRSPAYYAADESADFSASILTSEEYDRLIDSHPRPYVLEYKSNNAGAVVLYGSEHTKDPNDPQIADIQERWNEFEPTVLLIEGRLGFFIEGLHDPVRQYGEMGWAFSLAREDDVQTYTWEMPREQEIRYVLEEYPKERVALFYILRPYFSNLRFGKPEHPDAVVEEYIGDRGNYPGIEGAVTTVETIDAIWERDFPNERDWRDTSDQFGLPGYLSDIASRSGEARDQHLVHTIFDLARSGERVFAIAGSSHAVKIEPVLDAALSSE